MDAKPVIAAIRFAQGRRPSDPVPADPVAWLDSQLAPGLPGPELPSDLPTTQPAVFAAILEDNALLRAGTVGRPNQARIVRGETIAALALSIGGQQGFRERLVAFWANHLCVQRARVPNFTGLYVREVIRPHVTGRFEDMLLAMARHPGMLAYLDNNGSVGPNSPVGLRSRRGLNENLAREIMELHTITPAAGYSQEDVTSFARILTGWGFEQVRAPTGFVFRPQSHEPGPKTVMGRTFPPGEEGGVEALLWLARHDRTHRHLATKLVRHFVADDPPPAAVDRIHGVLRDTRGDLGAAAHALVRLPEAWANPLAKLRNSQDYVIAVLRAVEAPADSAERADGVMRLLGQTLWSAPAPIGYPDSAAAWAAPELMMRRIDWANGMAGRGAGRDAADLSEAVLGPLSRPETLRAAGRAGSAREALTLVLTAPEFHRR
ncbi:DUF1800 domain-containing protein [Roseomonas sp. CAU 1739]|uniref:DUF1800 domain-containing protein n=1 Tax=Roseomonas sp. CAU 1739 TaxID=3140364 RepID=UPI00325B9ECD